MASNMGPVVKGGVIKLIELIEPSHKTIKLLMSCRDRAVTSQPKVLGMDRVVMGEMAPRKRKHKSPKYVYVLQGPPGPKGQEGQPGQAGRDGRDGQNFTLTKELEETLKAHRPNLDTTGLENSFDQFGRTMFEVLNAQHRTNQKLEEQFRRANETQEYQAEAMQDMAQALSNEV